MRNGSIVVILSSAMLFACSATTQTAKSEGGDVWAGYQGTYATKMGDAEKGNKATPAKKETVTEAKAKAADPKEEAAPAPEPKADAPKKAASKTTLNGESISKIGAPALAEVSKSAFKSKNAAHKVTSGSQYEQVQIAMKGGVTVHVVRPTQSPGSATVASPKSRNDSLSKTEAAWYDEEADVLIVVNAGKKAAAQKALGQLLEK